MKLYIVALLCSATMCWSANAADERSWKHPEPITYESLRAWHQSGGLDHYIWPKELRADLNNDGKEETFLGVVGYSRGMTYALFTQKGGRWILLSDEIEGSHHDFELLPAKHGRWHEFRALQPSGRGGFFDFVYAWNGRRYVRKSAHEITADELRTKS